MFAERGAILAEAWQWWATTLTELDAVAWQRETRLPGWDVAALSAHASLLVRGLSVLSSQPLDTEPAVRSACDMLRGFNTPGGVATTFADGIAEMARRHAASMQPDGLVAAFTLTAPQVIASLERSGPIVIEYFGNGTFPIAEAMSIAVLEAVVHGLDLCAAVDWPASSIPPSPMQHTVGLLASMAEPVSFIEAATGRTSIPCCPFSADAGDTSAGDGGLAVSSRPAQHDADPMEVLCLTEQSTAAGLGFAELTRQIAHYNSQKSTWMRWYYSTKVMILVLGAATRS